MCYVLDSAPRAMTEDDFEWAAALMARRRELYAELSPVFWRPAAGAAGAHARFLRSAALREGAVGLRTDHGFAVAFPNDGRCFVDDFAVESDEQWMTEGVALLRGVWEHARSNEQPILRVVTAREDLPKRSMLAELGLAVAGRWWVKELVASGERAGFGPITVGESTILLVPAPPVYDPGGPVCLFGDVEPSLVDALCSEAAANGAVLAIVQREGPPGEVPMSEPALEAAGFHNPSEFFEGQSAA